MQQSLTIKTVHEFEQEQGEAYKTTHKKENKGKNDVTILEAQIKEIKTLIQPIKKEHRCK